MSTIKNFEFQFPERFEFDPTLLEFHTDLGTTSVRQFKTALGKNLLRSAIAQTDNPSIPTYILARLTDGNPATPFRYGDVTTFRYILPDNTDIGKITVKHEVGTQPNAVVIATSMDGATLNIVYSNDRTDSLGLGVFGTDQVFIATEEGLTVNLNCVRAKYVHVYTAGFISTGSDPSTNETRISEIEAYECVYSGVKPTLFTKESVRLTDFVDLVIDANETSTEYLLWNPLVNGEWFFFDGISWTKTSTPVQQSNTTAELLANIETLFLLPTVYELKFQSAFISELGAGTAVLNQLQVTYDNTAVNKGNTTKVYGQMIGTNGKPRTDVYVTYILEMNPKLDMAVELQGSSGKIILNDVVSTKPTENDKVDDQGVFFVDVVPNSLLSDEKAKYVFTFSKKNPKNDKEFIPVSSVECVIPKISKFNLGTQVIALI